MNRNAQRFAALVGHTIKAGTVPPLDNGPESVDDMDRFMGRVRCEAARIQSRARKARRTRQKAARKANRK